MDGALTYQPGYLQILHNMRDEADAKHNRALSSAVSLLIAEYISPSKHGLTVDQKVYRLRDIERYKQAAQLN